MPKPEPTEIIINEHGQEEHSSWLLIRANKVSSRPGAKLFDSEIRHQHFVRVSVTRCKRERDHNRDWLFNTETLIEFEMSEPQWGAFVSSFGNGTGVPATLSRWDGSLVPGVASDDSRLGVSHQEVKNATQRGLEQVQEAFARLEEAFENKLGVKETRARMNNLKHQMGNLPDNLKFAATSLTEHTEAVTVKMKADIEAMMKSVHRSGTLELEEVNKNLVIGD